MVSGSQDPRLTFQEVVKAAMVDSGTITVKGTFTCPTEFQGDKRIRGGAIGATMGFCYAAQVVEARWTRSPARSPRTKVWVAVDVGKALNPLAVEGQTQGGVWMGMGQALSEEIVYDKGGMLHGNILDYRVPTMMESPDIEVIIVESLDPNGPFGAKEASEGMLAGFLPAVQEAVYRRSACAPPNSRSAPTASPNCSTPRKPQHEHPRRFPHPSPRHPGRRGQCAGRRRGRSPAAGTDLLPNLRRGLGQPAVLVDLTGIGGLETISILADGSCASVPAPRWRPSPSTGSSATPGRHWPRRPRRSRVRPTAPRPLWAATCARTRAASSTTRASGGVPAAATASSTRATSATSSSRTIAATPPTTATSPRR